MRSSPLAPLVFAATLAHAATALGHSPAGSTFVAVEIYDRTDGTTLAVHQKDGRRYVVGTPGHEYALRVRNVSGRRVLAVTSVDGVNVVTGETASPEQSGYVLEPWGSVEIAGWRKSLAETAAFYFTEHRQSYAARTGRPLDVGVIGVAAFPERVPVAAWRDRQAFAGRSEPGAQPAAPERGRADAGGEADAPREAAAKSMPAPASAAADTAGVASAPSRAERELDSRLGTGHGRQEHSPVRQVRFERESPAPAQTYTVQYDRRENLIAQGILPAPYASYRRTPDPFPALSFVPNPPQR